MRKRLIDKAFAVAMTGAMAFTATPVTANIFNVAHVVKAAEADQAEEWTYCYVGLTWAEYWAHEDVYNAGDASSSDVLDSKKNQIKVDMMLLLEQQQNMDYIVEAISAWLPSLLQMQMVKLVLSTKFLTGLMMVKQSI